VHGIVSLVGIVVDIFAASAKTIAWRSVVSRMSGPYVALAQANKTLVPATLLPNGPIAPMGAFILVFQRIASCANCGSA